MRVIGAIAADYKSIRKAEVPLGGLTVLLGPNGSGKTNIIEAIGAHDPVARHTLRRADGRDSAPQGRLGLVVALDIDSVGHGADAELLRQMMVWPWREGLRPLEITDGIGAYCGSAWWLYGGDLYDPRNTATLEACYDVVRQSLIHGVPASAAADAQRLVDLLLTKPVLIVQEDFAVELACDRSSAAGREATGLAWRVQPLLTEGPLGDIVGVLTSWTGRWPPLTAFTRGPSGSSPAAPAGFEWVTGRLGGVRVVDGDSVAVERYLDQALETVHDRLFHQAETGDEMADDGFCVRCLHPDHAGRVDPSFYAADEAHAVDDLFVYPGSSDWLEQNNEWVRVRPELLVAISAIEHEANHRLIPFVAAQGEIQLEIRRAPEWSSSATRCRITFKHHDGEVRPIKADWNGPVGVVGTAYRQHHLGESIPLAHLGAGIQRWVATAVRLAADSCAEGETDPVPRILLIDEPELHLHPAAQAQVAAWCLAQAHAHQAVIVATHSPVFVALPPPEATICQVTKSGATTQVRALPPVHGPDVAVRARELGFELGLGRDALAQLTRAIVVVEGDWDRRLLHHFYGSQLAQERVLVVPLQGSNELGGLADAAVIPALGLPVVAFLDEVRGGSREDLVALTPPLTKAERALLDLSKHLGDHLRFVRYDDPDVICALPENAVRRTFPKASFSGWDLLLRQWKEEQATAETPTPFKKWALKAMGLPKAKRFPTTFFGDVIAQCLPEDSPHPRFQQAVEQLLKLVGPSPA